MAIGLTECSVMRLGCFEERWCGRHLFCRVQAEWIDVACRGSSVGWMEAVRVRSRLQGVGHARRLLPPSV